MASAHCYCDICVKNNMARLHLTFLHKKRLSTESSPSDPPSALNHVPVGTHALMCSNGHALRVKGGPGGAVGC
jgi:phenylpropionate dioxygenase-like ring-hydroxylating dioxygenase large terminal subunit